MKLKDVLAGVPVIKTNADPETEITFITRDSRAAGPGAMFAAIPALTGGKHGIDYADPRLPPAPRACCATGNARRAYRM